MNATLQNLAAKAKDLVAERAGLLAKGDALSDQELGRVDEIGADLDGIKAQITRANKIDAATKAAGEFETWMGTATLPVPLPGNPTRPAGFQPAGEVMVNSTGQLLSEVGPGIFGVKAWEAVQDPAYKKAFGRYLRHGERMGEAAYKALEDGLDPQGGYLVPVDFIQRIISKKPTPTRVAGMVQIINTGRDAISIPKVAYNTNSTDDSTGQLYTTGFRATWTDENPTSATSMDIADANTFGSIRIPVYTAMIKGKLTNNQVEDAAFDVSGWLESKLSETIELLRDNMIINGNGIQQPSGLLLNPGASDNSTPAVIVSGSASALAADQIIKLATAVPEQYEEGCRFLFNKTSTYQAIRLLKDGNQRYLFGAGYQDSGMAVGKPANLVGYPYVFSGFMPNVGSSTYPILFGDLQGYTYVNRIGFSIQVLRELYAPNNQVGILGRVRFGGMVTEPWRLKIGQCHT